MRHAWLALLMIFSVAIANATQWEVTGNLENATTVFSLCEGTDGSIFAGAKIDDETSCIFRSTDNGDSWVCPNTIETYRVRDVLEVKTGLLFAATSDGLFFSDNNGATWQIQRAYTEVFHNSPSAIIVDYHGHIVVSNSGGDIAKTTDFGATWNNTAELDPKPDLSCLFEASDNTIYASGDITRFGGVIYSTTDGGDSWEYLGKPENSGIITTVFEGSNDSIFAAGHTDPSEGVVYKMTPDGWQTILELPEIDTVEAALGTEGRLYAGMDADIASVYESTDNGESWQEMEGISNAQRVNDLLLASDGCIYAATGNVNGDVFKLCDTDTDDDDDNDTGSDDDDDNDSNASDDDDDDDGCG